MNQRDIPEIVAEFVYEMHEVRSELNALNGRIDRLDQAMQTGLNKLGQRFEDAMQRSTDQLVNAFSRSMGQHLTYLDQHGQQLKDHASRLNTLENPPA